MYWPLGAPRVYAAKKRWRSATDEGEDNQELKKTKSTEHIAQHATLLGLQIARGGQLFATITTTSLDIWQTSPVVLLASVVRSAPSLVNHGTNVAVLIRPDSSIAAVQTSLGFLITYSITIDPQSRVYQQQRLDEKIRRLSIAGRLAGAEESNGQREIHMRFRMVIKIDAGITKALALDDEIVVVTERRAAVQCIRWVPDNSGIQTNTELLNRLSWMTTRSNVVDIIHDRAMSLFVWVTGDGKAYAVQRIKGASREADGPNKLFRGYGFHTPDSQSSATTAAINARFSLLAVGCKNGEVHVYTARDYDGNIPLSHKLMPPASHSTTGSITTLIYSPDGYCLFVGYEHGWLMWSVYGKLGGSSFTSNGTVSEDNEERWLMGIQTGSWISAGSDLLFTCPNDDRLWILEVARSAVTGCFCPANVARMLLVTSSTLMVYQQRDISDLASISADTAQWHETQMPRSYLANQRPLRCAVISSDGRYIAVAGRRGLAHYSVYSGRWKTFDDPEAENAFVVRGGMCWYQHILVAAVEAGDRHELRLYSRELGLSESSLIHVEALASPVVTITPTGEDSLLVYTYENVLYHYIITATAKSVQVVGVGHIGLQGIVRAPARVRAVTWSVPEHQLLDGDPSQDVAHASVLFLVDAKLVLLQPSKDESGTSKYDMRIVANDVEYFNFTRDQYPLRTSGHSQSTPTSESNGSVSDTSLQESLWYFDGHQIQCWPDIQDLLRAASIEGSKDLPAPVPVTTDFYPTSIEISKGIIVGLEPELVQRRDVAFAFFRLSIRTQLFLPPILRHYLSTSDSLSALSLSHHYQKLTYFSHALEVLLHNVLDDEVDMPPPPDSAQLPTVLSFLSSFPDYLDILVQCTRKTEVRSWTTLFAHLPPPQELFKDSLQRGLLKTAAGYLLVLHTVEESDFSSEQCIHLLQMAKDAGDFDLCKELSRFLMALDESGDRLREAMQQIDLESTLDTNSHSMSASETTQLQIPTAKRIRPGEFSMFQNERPPSRASSANASPISALLPDDKSNDTQEQDRDTGYFSSRSH